MRVKRERPSQRRAHLLVQSYRLGQSTVFGFWLQTLTIDVQLPVQYYRIFSHSYH